MMQKQMEGNVANSLCSHQSTLADALIDAPKTEKVTAIEIAIFNSVTAFVQCAIKTKGKLYRKSSSIWPLQREYNIGSKIEFVVNGTDAKDDYCTSKLS